MDYQLGTYIHSDFLSQGQNDDPRSPQSALRRWVDLEQDYVEAGISSVFQDTNIYAGVDPDTSLGWNSASSLDIDLNLSPCPSLNDAPRLDVDFTLSSCPSLNDTFTSDLGSGLGFDLAFGRYQPRMAPVPSQSEVGSLSNHWDLAFAPFQPHMHPELDRHPAVSADNGVSGDLPEWDQTSTLKAPQSPKTIFSHTFSKGTETDTLENSLSTVDGLFRYPCAYPGCNKSFKRKEHSTRHYKSTWIQQNT
ncbi:zinc finger odd-paired-like (opl) [Fusarium pseudocircinatum]|uniref:Zinc finger odd-paired-like (Opl) n=1 Tax=Fusarium pseudocircinatum TaxID=56676 RepID=A0A8H5KHX1_9HYPO|nr:zinc finger odd-paired-like (opl) [Fusarium pseudocircinatum]